MSTYVIRTMTRDDIDLAIEWAACEGWNPGLYDAESYAAADSDGFFIGELSGEPIATFSAVKYGDTFGFLGFYIVSPAYRGQGYGIQIWRAGLEYLAGRNIGLDGVVAQQENYKKSGFILAHNNIRYEGMGGGELSATPDIVNLASVPHELLTAYDAPFFPADRSRFIQAWVRQPESHAVGMLCAGELRGYGVIRRCRTGYKIGPLFADTVAIAESLFSALKARVGATEPVYIDVPEANKAAVALAESHGMKGAFETARMYNREAPDMPMNRIFGVTSFEVG